MSCGGSKMRIKKPRMLSARVYPSACLYLTTGTHTHIQNSNPPGSSPAAKKAALSHARRTPRLLGAAGCWRRVAGLDILALRRHARVWCLTQPSAAARAHLPRPLARVAEPVRHLALRDAARLRQRAALRDRGVRAREAAGLPHPRGHTRNRCPCTVPRREFVAQTRAARRARASGAHLAGCSWQRRAPRSSAAAATRGVRVPLPMMPRQGQATQARRARLQQHQHHHHPRHPLHPRSRGPTRQTRRRLRSARASA